MYLEYIAIIEDVGSMHNRTVKLEIWYLLLRKTPLWIALSQHPHRSKVLIILFLYNIKKKQNMRREFAILIVKIITLVSFSKPKLAQYERYRKNICKHSP